MRYGAENPLGTLIEQFLVCGLLTGVTFSASVKFRVAAVEFQVVFSVDDDFGEVNRFLTA